MREAEHWACEAWKTVHCRREETGGREPYRPATTLPGEKVRVATQLGLFA
jgi:hypothetical protein